jgi:hypothetical protein
MAENYVLLETIELTQVAASMTLDNIPQTGYSDLKLVATLRGTISTNWADISINGGATATTQNHFLNLGSTTIYSQQYSPLRFQNNGSTFSSGSFSSGECYFFNYANTSYQKTMSMEATQSGSAGGYSQSFTSGIWASNSAITSITLTPDGGGNFAVGCTLSLYGLAATGTTPVTAPFASGGNIVANDGTYWYHAFLSSGTFTPFKALTCDYLVVAGGGAGAVPSGTASGGGGAGGYRTSIGGSPLSLTAIAYPVTVGAGGAGTTSTTVVSNGSNSVFSSITSTGGGGGGIATGTPVSGGNGGSGGGGPAYSNGNFGTGNTPSTSPSQGNNGGGGLSGNINGSGGGGGAGAVGQTAPGGSTAGAGGIGSNSASTWASATSTGVSGYYAGGGGGGAETGTGGAGGTGGGGAGSNEGKGTDGTANTGGGGGGSGNPMTGNPSSGGSGIVIVRYTMV